MRWRSRARRHCFTPAITLRARTWWRRTAWAAGSVRNSEIEQSRGRRIGHAGRSSGAARCPAMMASRSCRLPWVDDDETTAGEIPDIAGCDRGPMGEGGARDQCVRDADWQACSFAAGAHGGVALGTGAVETEKASGEPERDEGAETGMKLIPPAA